MQEPNFDSQGFDRGTFGPLVLHDCRKEEWKDVRLKFDDWGLLHKLVGADSIDGYYLNGYGVEGLVKAAMSEVGIDLDGNQARGG